MAETTKIEWTDHTASPWHGCTKVSPGCASCYAERQSVRNPLTLGVWGNDGTRVKSKSFIDKLRKWNSEGEAAGKPVKVFPSICDPFEDRPELVPWREEMFAAIDKCPWVTLLLLTKRPENIARMMPAASETGGNYHIKKTSGHLHLEVYRPNIWLGTSVEDQQRADERIPQLLAVPAKVRFLSCEPLLGPVDLHLEEDNSHVLQFERIADGIDWVIVGGESGPGARPCNVEWIRDIVRQCKAAGVPCFVKQLGSKPYTAGVSTQPGDIYTLEHCDGGRVEHHLKDKKGGDPSEWPEDLRVREMPASPLYEPDLIKSGK